MGPPSARDPAIVSLGASERMEVHALAGRLGPQTLHCRGYEGKVIWLRLRPWDLRDTAFWDSVLSSEKWEYLRGICEVYICCYKAAGPGHGRAQ